MPSTVDLTRIPEKMLGNPEMIEGDVGERQILFELGTARDPLREPLRHDEAVVAVAENVARQRARDGYGVHHMCPTSSGMS